MTVAAPKEIYEKVVHVSNSYIDFLLSQLRRDWIVEPPDFAWEQDQKFYDKIQLDARYRAVEETLLAEVAGLEWHVVADEEKTQKVAPIYEWAVNQISRFANARINLARAVIFGMSVLRIEGKIIYAKAPGDSITRRWWVPTKLYHIPRERLRRSIHYARDGKQYWRWNIYDPYINRWLPITDESRYIWSFYREGEENLGYGNGLARSLYYLMKFKVVLQELLAAGVERWVDSWIIIKLEDTLKATANLYNDESLNKLVDEIAKMRAHGILAVQDADVQVMSGGAGDMARAIIEMIEKLDREMTILMTASNLPTDIAEAGSYAATQAQMEQQNKRLIFQRQTVVAEPLSDFLMWAIYRNNLPNWRAMGVLHNPPYIQVTGGEVYDTAERLQVFQFALEQGIPVKEEDLRAQLKLSHVNPEDRVVKAKTQASPFSHTALSSSAPLPQKSSFPTPPQTETPFSFRIPRLFAEAAINEDLKSRDETDHTPKIITEALNQFADALLQISLNGEGFDAAKQEEQKLADTIAKLLAYYELEGRRTIAKEAVKDENGGPEGISEDTI